jgi:cytoskeletal protein CcmA (bactofilin family)
MSAGWAPLILVSATGAMMALPMMPAVVELVRRRDAAPLNTRKDDGNIQNFAASFRRYIRTAQPALNSCAERHALQEVRLRDGQYALVVGVSGLCGEIDLSFPNAVLFGRAVWLRDEQVFTKDVYAADVLHAGKKNVFRGVLGEKDIFLGEAGRVLRWIHAEGNVIAEPGVRFYGRLSAGESICLASSCRFERVWAPSVFVGPNTQSATFSPKQFASKISLMTDPRKAIGKLGRSRVDGDVHLRLGEVFLGNIVATGSIHVGEDTQILGSGKAHGEVRIEDRAQIHGAVVGRSVRIGADCYIQGPLLAEQSIDLGAGTRIGTLESPATVSAPHIRIGAGCVVHGTLWAGREGKVEA